MRPRRLVSGCRVCVDQRDVEGIAANRHDVIRLSHACRSAPADFLAVTALPFRFGTWRNEPPSRMPSRAANHEPVLVDELSKATDRALAKRVVKYMSMLKQRTTPAGSIVSASRSDRRKCRLSRAYSRAGVTTSVVPGSCCPPETCVVSSLRAADPSGIRITPEGVIDRSPSC